METETKVKRDAKDTVFRDLFTDPKYLLQLYQGLHPEDTETTEADLKIITLQRILTNGLYNDLGFLAKDRLMILVEAQSTWSPNIVLRALMYLMNTYQEYFNEVDANLYGTAIVDMPKPELYVVYTNEKGNHPDELSLKETFFPGSDCCIEAKAKIIYVDDSDTIINQYIKFCMVLKQQVSENGRTLTAIKNTIRICKNRNLLREYLASRETEVEGIMRTLFDQDRQTEIFGKEQRAAGRKEGRLEGRIQSAKEMIKAGLTSFAKIKASGLYSEKELAAIAGN